MFDDYYLQCFKMKTRFIKLKNNNNTSYFAQNAEI